MGDNTRSLRAAVRDLHNIYHTTSPTPNCTDYIKFRGAKNQTFPVLQTNWKYILLGYLLESSNPPHFSFHRKQEALKKPKTSPAQMCANENSLYLHVCSLSFISDPHWLLDINLYFHVSNKSKIVLYVQQK